MELKQMNPKAISLPLVVLASFCFLLSACGSGESSSSGSSSDTGSIYFNLVWENTSPSYIAGKSPGGDVCGDYAIDSVDVVVDDSSNAIVASQSWTCSAHQGTLEQVPEGSGLSLSIAGIVASNADWQGQATGITVRGGQNTDVGTIVMHYVGDDSTPPTVSAHSPAADEKDVFLNTAITATFSENVVAASVDTSCTVSENGTANPVAATVRYDASSWIASIQPNSQLKPNSSYTVTITTGIEDLAGLQLASNESWTFTTGTSTGHYLIWDDNDRLWDATLWN